MISDSDKLVIEVSERLFEVVSEGIEVINSNGFVGVVFIKGGLASINTVL